MVPVMAAAVCEAPFASQNVADVVRSRMGHEFLGFGQTHTSMNDSALTAASPRGRGGRGRRHAVCSSSSTLWSASNGA
jgi:hypothetical protein